MDAMVGWRNARTIDFPAGLVAGADAFGHEGYDCCEIDGYCEIRDGGEIDGCCKIDHGRSIDHG
jgi:hypothetical protein